VVELRRNNPNAPSQGYALRRTNPNGLSHVPTQELLLELRRRIVRPRDRHHETWDDWDGSTREATGPRKARNQARTGPGQKGTTMFKELESAAIWGLAAYRLRQLPPVDGEA
jgi:hypothetical protein